MNAQIILFFKALVSGYHRKDGTYVKPYHNKRTARVEASPGQMSLFGEAVPVSFDGLNPEPVHTAPVKEMIAEHERLVDVLESPSHADDKAEAKKQRKELEEYKREADAWPDHLLSDIPGAKWKRGKGLINGHYGVEVDGHVVGNYHAKPEDAAAEAKRMLSDRADHAKKQAETRGAKDALVDRLKGGGEVSDADLSLVGLRRGSSDLRWFIPAAADLFGIPSRAVRPHIADMIRVGHTDMGAKREYVSPEKALQAVAAGLNGGRAGDDPAAELRALWTEQGVPKEKQDALIAGIADKAKPGAKVGPFTIPDSKPEHHDLTPKQYHDRKLQDMADDNGVDLSEVREMYDDEAGRKSSEQEWVGHVRDAFKSGKPLSRQTLDKLEQLRPGSVASFWHDYPTAKVPEGYQVPGARKSEAEEKAARSENRKAAFAKPEPRVLLTKPAKSVSDDPDFASGWSSMSDSQRRLAIASTSPAMSDMRGNPNAKAKSLAAIGWSDLPDDIRTAVEMDVRLHLRSNRPRQAQVADTVPMQTESPSNASGHVESEDIGGVKFTAVRKTKPRPHWVAKINESGKEVDTITASTRGDLWDKIKRDMSAIGADRWRDALGLS